jgi:frataxin-like iron-binding protein CyaY
MTTDQSKIFFISSFLGDRNGDGRIKSDENFSDLKVYDFRTKECRIIINHSEPSAQLNLSPSGNLLAFVKANNIWILNTESEKFYQLTFDEGINPQWMVKDQSILFSSNGFLVKLDLDGNKWNYLTLGRGVEPNWINKKEIVVKSRGKFWQVSVDKIGVKELQKYPDNLRLTKGKSYEVYIDEVKLEPRSMNVTEVKARDLKTSQCWVIKPPWCNFPWAFKK